MGGFLLWLASLALVVVTVLALPSFETMFRDLGQPLPASTALVLNAGRLAHSWGGAATGVALIAASMYGFRKARRSPVFWGVLGCLTLLAIAWVVLCPVVMFGSLLETIKRIR
jgi:type II secretory pathway component PulF